MPRGRRLGGEHLQIHFNLFVSSHILQKLQTWCQAKIRGASYDTSASAARKHPPAVAMDLPKRQLAQDTNGETAEAATRNQPGGPFQVVVERSTAKVFHYNVPRKGNSWQAVETIEQ